MADSSPYDYKKRLRRRSVDSQNDLKRTITLHVPACAMTLRLNP
jgi:hypothetical protein